jgi:hypothetical protein
MDMAATLKVLRSRSGFNTHKPSANATVPARRFGRDTRDASRDRNPRRISIFGASNGGGVDDAA